VILSCQHLLDLLEQPENRSELVPRPGEDGPLHKLVCQPRPSKEKVELLVAMLNYASEVDINCKGKENMTPLLYAVQVFQARPDRENATSGISVYF